MPEFEVVATLDEVIVYALRKAIEEQEQAIQRVQRIMEKAGLDISQNYLMDWATNEAKLPKKEVTDG